MEAEGNSQHAVIKKEPSILVTKSHEIQAGYTQNASLSMSKSHFRGSAGDNRFSGQQLVPLVIFFCVTAFTCTRHDYQKSLLKHRDDN